MPSSNEYYKEYRRAERAMKSGERKNMIDNKYIIDFKSKKSEIPKFKKYYKDKLINKEQELLFALCLDLLILIEDDKYVIEKEGTYVKTSTGVLKVNPAKKEMKEDVKVFMSTLEALNQSLTIEDDDEDLESWLNG
ncbi:hypothetical protein [Paraclostridium bifermentans]|uniref:hypothetical protein n=1 Tax=Paraclostridium bifermentans TaxID=1490 RepID=UPI0022E7134D|nr:hypothetical protein [Paraclostridium bifermentans]